MHPVNILHYAASYWCFRSTDRNPCTSPHIYVLPQPWFLQDYRHHLLFLIVEKYPKPVEILHDDGERFMLSGVARHVVMEWPNLKEIANFVTLSYPPIFNRYFESQIFNIVLAKELNYYFLPTSWLTKTCVMLLLLPSVSVHECACIITKL